MSKVKMTDQEKEDLQAQIDDLSSQLATIQHELLLNKNVLPKPLHHKDYKSKMSDLSDKIAKLNKQLK